MTWKILNSFFSIDDLGFVPYIVDANDPRSVQAQIADKYAHGGGWSPYGKGDWIIDDDGVLKYTYDEPMKPWAMTQVHGEVVRFYAHAIVSVVHTDGSLSVLRLD